MAPVTVECLGCPEMIPPLSRIGSCPNPLTSPGCFGMAPARTSPLADFRGTTGAVRRPQDAPGATNAGMGDSQIVRVLFGPLRANLAVRSRDVQVAVVGPARPEWAQQGCRPVASDDGSNENTRLTWKPPTQNKDLRDLCERNYRTYKRNRDSI